MGHLEASLVGGPSLVLFPSLSMPSLELVSSRDRDMAQPGWNTGGQVSWVGRSTVPAAEGTSISLLGGLRASLSGILKVGRSGQGPGFLASLRHRKQSSGAGGIGGPVWPGHSIASQNWGASCSPLPLTLLVVSERPRGPFQTISSRPVLGLPL